MKRLPVSAVIMLMAASGLYGIFVERAHIFPHSVLSRVHSLFVESHNWSIGIYTGSAPFSLTDPEDIDNPVLVASDITDRDAKFVADPFIVAAGSKYLMFFEVFDREEQQGDIAVAESEDGKEWEYKQIVLDEPFHLSYPYIFEWENEYYLIPESHEDLSVRLYKAINFPTQWEFVKTLVSGYHFVDPSVTWHDGIWWMFVAVRENDALNLFYADELAGPWTQHPDSPIVKGNKHFARPAGRLIEYREKLVRLAQDDDPIYGKQVFAFEVTTMNKTQYTDKLLTESPVLVPGSSNWNSLGMHTLNIIRVGQDDWLAAVDGQ